MSALTLKSAMTEEAMLAVAQRIATNAAIRAILSRPGKERKVTDALKTIAAFHNEGRCEERFAKTGE
jgi:hypothetical protein